MTSSASPLAAVLVATVTISSGGSFRDLCWQGEYDADRCCAGRDPSCWDAVFTAEQCCPGDLSFTQGNPRCWLDGYSYKDCCRPDPKVGCWDSQYSPERCCTEPGEDTLGGGSFSVADEDVTDAYARRLTAATRGALGCADSPRGLWRAVREASAALNVSREYGMPGPAVETLLRKTLLRWLLTWLADPDAWAEALAACPVGVLNAIDLSVASIDREVSEDAARGAYRLYQTVQGVVVGDWPFQGMGNKHVPRLLGLSPRHACHGTHLRIFVYSIPSFAHMLRPVLTCSQKMSQCAASVHIHRWIMSGGCTTDDPSSADLFYFPAYEACYNETACGVDEDTERCFPRSFDPHTNLTHFSRRHGADHFFIFGCNLLPFSDSLMSAARQSIMVTVESFQAKNYAGPDMLAWFSHWKDVLIPGYIPSWRISAMLSFNKPMIQRPLLLAFHGHSAGSPTVGHMYRRSPLAEVRDRVLGYFANVSDASVGPPVRDYFRRLGMSRFCLVPAGLTAWTIHLYEAFFFGCVPVILSDELTVPYQDEIDWQSLSLQVPTSISMPELHAKLASFSLGRLKAMYRGLEAARCWFDYDRGWEPAEGAIDRADNPGGCSPYLGLVRALERRVRTAGSIYHLPRFWEPAPRT